MQTIISKALDTTIEIWMPNFGAFLVWYSPSTFHWRLPYCCLPDKGICYSISSKFASPLLPYYCFKSSRWQRLFMNRNNGFWPFDWTKSAKYLMMCIFLLRRVLEGYFSPWQNYQHPDPNYHKHLWIWFF